MKYDSVIERRQQMFELTDMDYVRGAIVNAILEEMTLSDLWECAANARDPESFDNAVNILAQTQ